MGIFGFLDSTLKKQIRNYISTFLLCSLFLLCESCAHRRNKENLNSVSLERTENGSIGIKSKEAIEEVKDSDIFSIILPQIPKGYPNQIIRRKAYTLSYNSSTKAPNWVAWCLTSSHTSGHVSRKNYDFQEDTDVPVPRATTKDWNYNSTGYQKGHMCPAGDNKWDAEAMAQTFLLSNICQQDGNLNQYDWEELEDRCRQWANEYGEIYIICGPLFYSSHYKVLGKNKVAVPDAFYKVILRLKPSPQELGFIYPNNDQSHHIEHYLLSVDDVERKTKFKFFSALPDNIKNRIEKISYLSQWR